MFQKKNSSTSNVCFRGNRIGVNSFMSRKTYKASQSSVSCSVRRNNSFSLVLQISLGQWSDFIIRLDDKKVTAIVVVTERVTPIKGDRDGIMSMYLRMLRTSSDVIHIHFSFFIIFFIWVFSWGKSPCDQWDFLLRMSSAASSRTSCSSS